MKFTDPNLRFSELFLFMGGPAFSYGEAYLQPVAGGKFILSGSVPLSADSEPNLVKMMKKEIDFALVIWYNES